VANHPATLLWPPSTSAFGARFNVIYLPGDKSITHRALLMAAIADGTSILRGINTSDDCLATLVVLRQLGVRIECLNAHTVRVFGVGKVGFKKPSVPLDCGNAGTLMRLLAGILAGQSFVSTLTGDASLCRRPMARIIEPLTTMGTKVQSETGTAPLIFHPVEHLNAGAIELPVASAQVKSCLLLASLYATGEMQIVSPALSRDHTERMLPLFGVTGLQVNDKTIRLPAGQSLTAADLSVPGDPSSAAFWVVASLLAASRPVIIKNVLLNKSRSAVFSVLKRMGARISCYNRRDLGGDVIADLKVFPSALRGIHIESSVIADVIDELPILFVAAACATGVTRVQGADELRHKESDRLSVMIAGLQRLGVRAQATGGDAMIVGGPLGGGSIDCHHDHRVAMAFSVAALRASRRVCLRNASEVATSYKDFFAVGKRLGLGGSRLWLS
jgi:3-phosphoshikimate 1-carboxyvinyltransferase